ncbi:MAG: hypothetical protein ACLPPF_08610 [Rhodomicrobium sp.]
MSSKIEAFVRINDDPILYEGLDLASAESGSGPADLAALNSNIRESLDEIDILRGTIQYWEGRRDPADPKERELLKEAFRIMHGELLGMTARMRELLNRTELG